MGCEGIWGVEFWEAGVEDGSHVEGDEEGAGCMGGGCGIVRALYVQKVSVLGFWFLIVFTVCVLGKREDKSSIPFTISSCFVVISAAAHKILGGTCYKKRTGEKSGKRTK